jgi:hypothetical protein
MAKMDSRMILLQKHLRDNIVGVENINSYISEIRLFREETITRISHIESNIIKLLDSSESIINKEIEIMKRDIVSLHNQIKVNTEKYESIEEYKLEFNKFKNDINVRILEVESNIKILLAKIHRYEHKVKNEDGGGPEPPPNIQGEIEGGVPNIPGRQGAPRGQRSSPTDTQKGHKKYPEIILTKNGWIWSIYLEIPDNSDNLEIKQGEKILTEFDNYHQNIPISNLNVKIEISINNNYKDIDLCTGNRNYLIFKMRNNWNQPGRLVNSITSGFYGIVVPNAWKMSKETSRYSTLDSEEIENEGYTVNFIYITREDEGEIIFLTEYETEVIIKSDRYGYQLTGNPLPDAAKNLGPLFVGKLPVLESKDDTGWDNISTIVVGEEGGGYKRKSMDFKPNKSSRMQALPHDILQWNCGWFFIRILDDNMTLVDSMDFRFLEDLSGVSIENSRDYPTSNGYEDIKIIFTHSPGSKIIYEKINIVDQLKIIENQEETIITIPPGIEYDNINFKIKGNYRVADYLYCNKRIWWALIDNDDINENDIVWKDATEVLYKSDISATTNSVLLLKNCTGDIYIGFQESKPRIYKGSKDRPYTKIYLRDFSDAEEFEILSNERSINLFLPSDEEIIKIPLLLVKTKLSCLHCPFSTELIEDANAHINTHIDKLFPHLSYEEIAKKRGGEFPDIIYKCGYCDDFFVGVDRAINPTGRMFKHISENHRSEDGVCHNILFSVISDAAIIRKNVYKNLPHIYKCAICDYEWEGKDMGGERVEHLIRTHINDIFSSK